jgi:branched-chain amino acid transport system ATP-binding protein
LDGKLALLEVRNLTKDFGGLRAVDQLNLDVNQGEVRGLIGPNGAGKTTVFNVVTGFLPATSGIVIFGGEDINNLKSHIIAKKGLVRTFQLTAQFSNLSVLDNVLVGCHLHSRIRFFGALFKTPPTQRKQRTTEKKALEILEFMGLHHIKDELAKNLPHGHQRTLEIAVALGAEPKMLMLDEPCTGMNIEETNTMVETIGRLRDAGITIMLVEHDMRAVMGICNRITVLDFGREIAEGSPDEVKEDPEVIKVYLGA